MGFAFDKCEETTKPTREVAGKLEEARGKKAVKKKRVYMLKENKRMSFSLPADGGADLIAAKGTVGSLGRQWPGSPEGRHDWSRGIEDDGRPVVWRSRHFLIFIYRTRTTFCHGTGASLTFALLRHSRVGYIFRRRKKSRFIPVGEILLLGTHSR